MAESRSKGTALTNVLNYRTDPVNFVCSCESFLTSPASTIEVYVAAVIDLYKQQRKVGRNPHPEGPQTTLVKDLLAARRSTEHNLKRRECPDRGKGTLQDGYSQQQFESMLAWCYAIPPHLPSVRASLHAAVDFLFTHHMLLRLYGVHFTLEVDAAILVGQLNRPVLDIPSSVVARWIAWIL